MQRRRVRIQGRELAFVRAVTDLQLTKGLTYRQLAARAMRIERFHVRQHSGNRFLGREVRRRIAELLLREAILRGCSFEVCRSRMKNLRKLGFTDIEQKSMYTFFYARARDRGYLRVARRTATAMESELSRSLRRKPNPLGKANLKALTSLLEELNGVGGLSSRGVRRPT